MKVTATRRDAYRFFHKGTLALSRVEHNGIRVDTAYLDKAINKVSHDVKIAETELKQDKVWKEWRRRFREPNLGSIKQLGTVLSGLGYKSIEKTEKKNDKWDERALDNIDLPFVRLYNQTKKLWKTLNTYLKGIRRETVNGFIHPSFNLAGGLEDDDAGGAMSYRGSSSNPNFQNMPIRNKKMGELIRKCFIARKGYRLAEVDFSTIEVRIAACCSHDPNLMNYVVKGDMHGDAARKLFFLDKDEVDKKTTRDAAKNKFVFPQFYGSYYVDCALAIWESMIRNEWKIPNSDELIRDRLKANGVRKRGDHDKENPQPPLRGTFMHHVKQVQDYLWNTMFPVYNRWRKQWYETYLETGVVPMYTGFEAVGYFRKNQVLNLPIQGPAFHCLLWSIITLQEIFDFLGLKSMIVGQIHDCVLIDIHESEVQQVLDLCHLVMTRKLPKAWDWICVPLEIEVDVVPKGLSWHDKRPWINEDGLWAEKA